MEVWRSAVAHRVKLQGAAETYSRLRSVARGLEKWKRRWEEERVREKKAEVVRDFFVTRRAWRRWSEEVWERKRATWEVERRRKRAKETLDCEFCPAISSAPEADLSFACAHQTGSPSFGNDDETASSLRSYSASKDRSVAASPGIFANR